MSCGEHLTNTHGRCFVPPSCPPGARVTLVKIGADRINTVNSCPSSAPPCSQRRHHRNAVVWVVLCSFCQCNLYLQWCDLKTTFKGVCRLLPPPAPRFPTYWTCKWPMAAFCCAGGHRGGAAPSLSSAGADPLTDRPRWKQPLLWNRICWEISWKQNNSLFATGEMCCLGWGVGPERTWGPQVGPQGSGED